MLVGYRVIKYLQRIATVCETLLIGGKERGGHTLVSAMVIGEILRQFRDIASLMILCGVGSCGND